MVGMGPKAMDNAILVVSTWTTGISSKDRNPTVEDRKIVASKASASKCTCLVSNIEVLASDHVD